MASREGSGCGCRAWFLGLCLVLLLMSGASLSVVEGGKFPVLFPVAPCARAASSFDVVGSPSICADLIDRVLAAYHSPASGEGQHLYGDGVAVGIDPVFALAFFMHEDTFGLYGWGAANHSLGNIRCTPGYRCQGGYRAYAAWDDGFKDWYQLVRDQYVDRWGLRTVDRIIPVYAPSADHNDVCAYINAVKVAVATWRAGRIVVSVSGSACMASR
ncbi:MAG TPA: hypothetical protein VFB12_28085 [Ktedonobacteraceae bacterium]|nr:hypothetical protein [Ktedonobacteraceae bacterium]